MNTWDLPIHSNVTAQKENGHDMRCSIRLSEVATPKITTSKVAAIAAPIATISAPVTSIT
jgi:hypothetical protein